MKVLSIPVSNMKTKTMTWKNPVTRKTMLSYIQNKRHVPQENKAQTMRQKQRRKNEGIKEKQISWKRVFTRVPPDESSPQPCRSSTRIKTTIPLLDFLTVCGCSLKVIHVILLITTLNESRLREEGRLLSALYMDSEITVKGIMNNYNVKTIIVHIVNQLCF